MKLTISRTNRPCFKSGVWVSPEWFKPVLETKKGFVYDVVIPKKGRLNVMEVREAEAAKATLSAYVSKLVAVSNALSNGQENVTHNAIDEAMNVTRDMVTTAITYQSIREAKANIEHQELMPSKDFFDWMDLYLKKKELSEGRKRGFRVLVRMLARYQSFVRMTDKERSGFTLDVDTLDKETVEDFFDYASNEKTLSEEYPEIFKKLLSEYPPEISPKHKKSTICERGRNVMIERKKQLRAFFRWMLEEGYSKNQPFEGVKIGSEVYGTPYYLTVAERNIVADWDFSENKHLESQRDIFLLQCLIGCRVSDLLTLTKDNVVEKDGVEVIEYIPRKTKGKNPVVVTVPMNERAKRLVGKYLNSDNKRGKLLPVISSQKYNDTIKEILKECRINRMVSVINPTSGEEEQRPICEVASSHMARRTFIGNLYKKLKDPSLIGKLSGHAEGSRAFCRYRDIDLDMMRETVNLID